MFTLDQINLIHKQLGKQATLFQYLQALRAIGVNKYDSFVADGHSEYYGNDNQKLMSAPLHEKFTIANESNKEGLLRHLNLHNQGKTDYLEMTKGLADSGIEKWTFDTIKMSITYYDMDGHQMLVERII
jgi:uncharacterized protein YbcV (DUF1398 family)